LHDFGAYQSFLIPHCVYVISGCVKTGGLGSISPMFSVWDYSGSVIIIHTYTSTFTFTFTRLYINIYIYSHALFLQNTSIFEINNTISFSHENAIYICTYIFLINKASSRGLHSMNLLSSPNSIYAIVVCLTNPPVELRRQVKYWLKLLIASIGIHKVATMPLVIIGTRYKSYKHTHTRVWGGGCKSCVYLFYVHVCCINV
jgi:hypothetical protein